MSRSSKRNRFAVRDFAAVSSEVRIQLFVPAMLKFCLFSVAEDT
jgi:hypothetical protein